MRFLVASTYLLSYETMFASINDNTSTKIKSKSRCKKKTTYQLSNKEFRVEYRDKLSLNQDHELKHKEICFQHVLLPILQKYHLCPNQVPSFKSNEDYYSPLSLPCTNTSCKKISHDYIFKYNMKKKFCVTMRSLNIGWSLKTKNMDDLCLEIYDANKHCLIVQHKYKLMKLIASDIKRYTQPFTQKDVVCSAVFDKTELFMVIHESKPRVVMSIGVRKDNWAKYGKVQISNNRKKDPNLQPQSDVDLSWYLAWGLSGIQEVSIFIIQHINKFQI